jgi:hypothetical protein
MLITKNIRVEWLFEEDMKMMHMTGRVCSHIRYYFRDKC